MRRGLSSVYGFIMIFTLLITGMGATMSIIHAQGSIWNAQSRATQVEQTRQLERLSLSLNGTSLVVENVGLIPSDILYLHQVGAVSTADRRLGGSVQEGTSLTIPVSAGMQRFAVITSLGNVFWVSNGTATGQGLLGSLVPVTFDASGLSPPFNASVVATVDSVTLTYSQLPKTFEWAPGSTHTYSFAASFPSGQGTRVGWSSTRGIAGSREGTIKASQSGSVVSSYALQYLLTVTGGNSIQYLGSPGNDGWYDAGSSAQISSNYAWNQTVAQSRLNLVAYSIDSSTPISVPRSGSGTFTTTSVTVNTFHTVNFNSVTQYYVTTAASVPSGASVAALAISFSYNSPAAVSGSAGGFSLAAGSRSSYLVSGATVSMPASRISYTMSVTGVSDTAAGDKLLFNWPNCNENSPQYSLTASPQTLSYTSNAPGCLAGSSFNIFYYGGCLNSNYDPPRSILCGTITGSGQQDSVSYTVSTSGSTSSSSNTFTVSSTTATYSYGVGYSFPGGSSSTSWSATWPSTETYSTNNCAGGSVSGTTISGTGGACTLTTTRAGTTPITLGASPTADGWYDSGVSVTLSTAPTGPFSFSSWSPSRVNLVIGSASLASTTVTPNTYGTMTANFNVSQ